MCTPAMRMLASNKVSHNMVAGFKLLCCEKTNNNKYSCHCEHTIGMKYVLWCPPKDINYLFVGRGFFVGFFDVVFQAMKQVDNNRQTFILSMSL